MTKQFALYCSASVMEHAQAISDKLLRLLRTAGLAQPPAPANFDGLLEELFDLWPLGANERQAAILADRVPPEPAAFALAA